MKTLERNTGMEIQALLVFSHAYVVDKVSAKRRSVTILPPAIYDRLCLAVGEPPSP